MSEERLIELETRLAFQDDALQALSESCLALQRRMEALELRLETAESRLKALAPSAVVSQAEETPPPHY